MTAGGWRDLRPVGYDFALSYAFRDAAIVRPVAAELIARGYRTFECSDALADAWGLQLTTYLDAVFQGEAACCVVFLSQAYLAGRWASYEWTKIRSSAPRTPCDIAVIRLDDTPAALDARCRVVPCRTTYDRNPTRLVHLLVRHLLDIEGLAAAGDGGLPLEIVATSPRTTDRKELLASMAAAGAFDGRIVVRVPRDFHVLYAAVRRALTTSWPWPYWRDKGEVIVQWVDTEMMPRLARGLRLLRSCADRRVWSDEETLPGIEAFVLAEVFRGLRGLASFAGLLGDDAPQRHAYRSLERKPEAGSMVEVLPMVLQDDERSITFWTDVDVADTHDVVPPVRKRVFVPSTMYLPRRFACSTQDFMRVIVPQLLDWTLESNNDALLRCLLAYPQRVDVRTREEWLIDPVRYSRVNTHRRSTALDDARTATERRLRSLMAAGRLNDGLEHVPVDERVWFHMGRMPMSKTQ